VSFNAIKLTVKINHHNTDSEAIRYLNEGLGSERKQRESIQFDLAKGIAFRSTRESRKAGTVTSEEGDW
jgi:hypothetical protein